MRIIPAALFLFLLLPGLVMAAETLHPRLPAKNCVEDAAIKRQIAEQQALVLATLREMEPRLNTGPASLGAIRKQCLDLFEDAEKCGSLGSRAIE